MPKRKVSSRKGSQPAPSEQENVQAEVEASDAQESPSPAKKPRGRGRPPTKGKKPQTTSKKGKGKKGRPQSKNEDEDREYEVETILDVRVVARGRKEFLVKWAGYPHTKSTWEPHTNLTACQDQLEMFLHKRERDELRQARVEAAEAKAKAQADEDGEEYTVDSILNVRERNGTQEFLVKWVGYPRNKATWEPEENLTDCAEKMKAFMKIKKGKQVPDTGLSKKARQKMPGSSRKAKAGGRGSR